MVTNMAFHVYLGRAFDAQYFGMEDGEVRDSFGGKTQPFFEEPFGRVIQRHQVSLVDVVNRQVEPHGGEDILRVDSSLELSSHLCVVQVSQLLFQLGVEEGEVISRGIPMGDGGAEELGWVILHGRDGDVITLFVLKVELGVLDLSSLDGEATALTGFVGEAH